MKLRRLFLALFFLSLSQMVLAEAALALVAAEARTVSQTATDDPCADEEKEADCPDKKAVSQVPADSEGLPLATLRTASDCESNSCTGTECFIRGSCGSIAVYLGNKFSISGCELVSIYSDFIPHAAQGPDPSQPIRPPIS